MVIYAGFFFLYFSRAEKHEVPFKNYLLIEGASYSQRNDFKAELIEFNENLLVIENSSKYLW